MRTSPLLALGMVALSALPSWTAEAPKAPPTFGTEVELITVDAVVVDKEGRPVPGLTKDDFVIEEDGQVQDIVSFEASTADFPVEGAPAPEAPTAAVSPK